jgi:cytidylate kinase
MKVVCFFGSTCVGKTTVARALGLALRVPVRHCGTRIREACIQADAPDSYTLPLSHHQVVDAETVRVASAHSVGVIDGQHLDLVLRRVPGVFLVRLECSVPVRGERMARRLADGGDGTAAVLKRDADDAALRLRLYSDHGSARRPDLSIHTDALPVAAVVELVLAAGVVV